MLPPSGKLANASRPGEHRLANEDRSLCSPSGVWVYRLPPIAWQTVMTATPTEL